MTIERHNTPPTSIIAAIKNAQNQNDFDDAKFQFLLHDPTIKAVTSQVMAHLVKQQIVTGEDTVCDFSALYFEVMDIVGESLLNSSSWLIQVIEAHNAIADWQHAQSRRLSSGKVPRLSAAELMLIARHRAAQGMTSAEKVFAAADKDETQEMKPVSVSTEKSAYADSSVEALPQTDALQFGFTLIDAIEAIETLAQDDTPPPAR